MTVRPAEPTVREKAIVVARIDRADELGPYSNISEWLGEIPDEVTAIPLVNGETVASMGVTVRAGRTATVGFDHEFAVA